VGGPIAAAARRLEATLGEMQELTADEARQQERLRALEPLVAIRIEVARRAHEALAEAGLPGVEAQLRGENAAETSLRARVLLDEMAADEERELRERTAGTASETRVTLATVVAGSLLSVLLLGLAWGQIARDMDARQKTARELRASESRFRGLVRDVPVGVVVHGSDARITLANPKALELLGVPEEQLLGRTSYDPSWNVVDEDGRVLPGAELPVPRAITTRRAVRDAVIGVQRPGESERVWLLMNADPEASMDGTLLQVVCTFHDISERKAAELRLEQANATLQRLSLVDAVTDVANRRQFDRALADEWARATRTGSSIAIVLVDVDHFKPYNDRYGHPAGDECLRSIASVLARTLLRAGDLVSRYGGEEFAAILPLTDSDAATAVAERMRKGVEALAMPHGAVPRGIVTISGGVASSRPEIDSNALDLVARADAALYEAKASGRNRVVTSPESDAAPVRPSEG
ncbi:MAG: diguanylate cyclase, partial [Thermoanaerobaculia bacterium]